MPGKSRQSANLVSNGKIFADTSTGNVSIGSSFIVYSQSGIVTATKFFGDGSGLSNISGGGSGGGIRTTVTGITTAIAPNGIGNTDISGFKVYNILKVGISTASWVRIYTDSVSRTNDVSRVINNDPISGSGVIAEFISVGATTIKTGPVPTGYNDDTPETNQIYVSVTNLSGISTTIQVSLTILKLEG